MNAAGSETTSSVDKRASKFFSPTFSKMIFIFSVSTATTRPIPTQVDVHSSPTFHARNPQWNLLPTLRHFNLADCARPAIDNVIARPSRQTKNKSTLGVSLSM
jgi:hypothetical protein